MTGERPAPGADRPPTDPPPAAPTGVDRAGADPAAILAALKAAGQTVAVAESVTGGLLSAALSEPAGASAVFRGGLVVYATDLKASIAGVPAPLLAAEGPVSPDVAGALAAGARDRLAATYGLSLTGVAGPDRQEGIDVGVVYVGLAGPGGGEVRRLSLTGDRARIRAGSVAGALAVLAERLAVTAPDPRVPAVRRESAV
ncbi:MAG TPA: CinA family protein [Mycobacteriales bacterium]